MTKKLLYGVGLFLVGLMVLGLAINTIGILIGNAHPLNTGVIISLFWIIIVILILFNKKLVINWIKCWDIKSVPISVWLLVLLPVMAIGGAELVNAMNNNIILMIMLPLLVVVPIVCMFTKLIPKKYWAFAIWMISLSILLHRALISSNLAGSDNIWELSCFRTTYINSIFPSTDVFATGYNTVLSVTILPVVISKITFISGIWIFKLIFPIFLSIVPVAIYEFIKNHFDETIAFLSSVFIMGTYTFFTIMIEIDKQLIATVLFSIFLVMLFDKIKYKYILLGLLGAGIIVAHYGSAILFLVLLAGVAIVSRKKENIILTAILGIIGIVWYKVQGNGAVVNQMVNLGQSAIVDSNTSGIRQSIVIRMFTFGSTYLPLWLLIVYIISQILIVLGFVYTVWNRIKNRNKINLEYLALSVMLLGILGLLLVVPNLSNILGIERIYFYCMMILVPFMFIMLFKLAKKWFIVISILLTAIYLLGNVGFINQIIGKPLSDSIALSKIYDYPVITDKELDGANWILNNSSQPIYVDNYSQYIFYYIDISPLITLDRVAPYLLLFKLNNDKPIITNNVPSGSYIYLRKYNLQSNELTLRYYISKYEGTMAFPMSDYKGFYNVINSAKTVYENSDCKIIQTIVDYKGE